MSKKSPYSRTKCSKLPPKAQLLETDVEKYLPSDDIALLNSLTKRYPQ